MVFDVQYRIGCVRVERRPVGRPGAVDDGSKSGKERRWVEGLSRRQRPILLGGHPFEDAGGLRVRDGIAGVDVLIRCVNNAITTLLKWVLLDGFTTAVAELLDLLVIE